MSGDKIALTPVVVSNAADFLEKSAPGLLTVARDVRAIDTSSMPPDLAGEVNSWLGITSSEVMEIGVDFGAKGRMLRSRIEALERFEKLSASGHFLNLGGFSNFLWDQIVLETDVFGSKTLTRYRTVYASAAMLALSSRSGPLTIESLEKAHKRLEEIRRKAATKVPPKLKKVPGWIKRFRVIPGVGIGADLYVGYHQSSATGTMTKVQSTVTSTLGNNVPIVSLGQDVFDTGAWASGNDEYSSSQYVTAQIDADTMAHKGQWDELKVQHHRIKTGQLGAWMKKAYGDMTPDEYVKFWKEQIK